MGANKVLSYWLLVCRKLFRVMEVRFFAPMRQRVSREAYSLAAVSSRSAHPAVWKPRFHVKLRGWRMAAQGGAGGKPCTRLLELPALVSRVLVNLSGLFRGFNS